MKILLTNDDGYQAPGILALYEILQVDHDVMLIAPDREKSAVSHGITLNETLRILSVTLNNGRKGYGITGTPADCIKLGLYELCKTPPDLVISGINAGSNTGVNINYSGTVGAAREAALNGLPSIAASIKRGKIMDFQGLARFISSIAGHFCGTAFPRGTLLNINAPAMKLDQARGVKITRQSAMNLSTRFEKREDPRGRPYFWYGSLDPVSNEPDTDDHAVSENYISITPIQCDTTDYRVVDELECISWLKFN